MKISEDSKLIAIKFYLKHHWGKGNAAWVFGADQFRTHASMATDSFHRVKMGKINVITFFSNVFDRILYICVGNYNMNENFDEFEIWADLTTELAALQCMKKYPIDL